MRRLLLLGLALLASLAATAAASGYNPAYTMAENPMQNSLPQTSPQIKTDGSGLQRPSPQSPRQQNPMQVPGSLSGQMNMPSAQAMSNNIPQQMQQQAQRRMSHTVPSPALPSQQAQHAMSAPIRPPTQPSQQQPPPPPPRGSDEPCQQSVCLRVVAEPHSSPWNLHGSAVATW